MENHLRLIDLAVYSHADVIIFPELSLTGYEPELARKLAVNPDDSSFDQFQKISDVHEITIGVGVPTKNGAGTNISMLLFHPHKARQTYSKSYLHTDEELFFIAGQSSAGLIANQPDIALAICYELSVPEHAGTAYKNGAKTYMASVAKTANGVEKASETLSAIAQKYTMLVLMSNCIGPSADGDCGGKTGIWNRDGLLLGQLDDSHEGIIMIDTETQEIIQAYFPTPR